MASRGRGEVGGGGGGLVSQESKLWCCVGEEWKGMGFFWQVFLNSYMLVTQYNTNYYNMIDITIHKIVVTVTLHSIYKT